MHRFGYSISGQLPDHESWIENYVLQAAISWWLYPVIWGVLVLLLTLCTGWRIQKAANQNPAEVIKSE